MEILKNISVTLTKAAEATTKKASELTDTAKLKVKRSRIVAGINETYGEIGQLIYTQYKETSDESAAIAELCLAIDKANEELNAVDTEIAEIKAAAEAAKAKAQAERAAAKAAAEAAAAEKAAAEKAAAEAAEKEAAEASEAETEEAAAAEEAPAHVCSACGTTLPADALFCCKCGQKQE